MGRNFFLVHSEAKMSEEFDFSDIKWWIRVRHRQAQVETLRKISLTEQKWHKFFFYKTFLIIAFYQKKNQVDVNAPFLLLICTKYGTKIVFFFGGRVKMKHDARSKFFLNLFFFLPRRKFKKNDFLFVFFYFQFLQIWKFNKFENDCKFRKYFKEKFVHLPCVVLKIINFFENKNI